MAAFPPDPRDRSAGPALKSRLRAGLGAAYALAKQALPEPVRLRLKDAVRSRLRGSPAAARLVTDYLPIDLRDPARQGERDGTGAPSGTHQFWGLAVQNQGADASPVEVDPGDPGSVHRGFLALNGLYLRLAASPHLSLSDRHVQQEASYQQVLAAFRSSGLPMRDYAMDAASFEAYLQSSLPAYHAHGDYANNQGGLTGYFPQKALEHWISSDLLKWGPSDVVLDFAAWISPAVEVLGTYRPAQFYKHDIMLKTDLAKRHVAGWSDAVEAPDAMFDVVMAHCSIDNFEKDYDTKFFKEVRRILKPGGRVLITPLHMSARFENRVALGSPGVATDDGATLVLGPPGSLRFARLYDVDALRRRVIDVSTGLRFEVIHVTGLPLKKYPDTCTNRFMLLGTKTG
jgi:SAM-dependent methyltransferase